MVTKSRSGKTTTLSGKFGTAAEAIPGATKSDIPRPPRATPANAVLRTRRLGSRAAWRGPEATPVVTPGLLGLDMVPPGGTRMPPHGFVRGSARVEDTLLQN